MRRLLIAAALIQIFSSYLAPARCNAEEHEWKQVTAPREWSFPRDFGSHPEYRTEWWYFTGNLSGVGTGKRYGYQLTIFRIGVEKETDPAEVWELDDVYAGHLAVTDGEGKRFLYTDRLSRTGPGLAGATEYGMHVKLLGWRADTVGDWSGGNGQEIKISARDRGLALSLTLKPAKPPVLNGEGGVSRKGPAEGQASHYVSMTRLESVGELRFEGIDEPVEVEGLSWYDQEFGSNQLAKDQVGWDWVSLHLTDGRDLMIYLMRKSDGTVEPTSSGTLVEADGTKVDLSLDEFTLTARRTWQSPHTGAKYPAGWSLKVPGYGISLDLEALVADQELHTGNSTGVSYWEGAVSGWGNSGGRKVRTSGYIELTGYAEAMGETF